MNTRAILIGLALGLGLGVTASVTGSPALLRAAEAVDPLGQVFLRAIQMVVIPLVAAIVFVGVGRIGNLRKLGRIGGLAVGFFWVTTLPAILIGMGVMRLGLSFTAPVAPPTDVAEIATEAPGVVDFLVNLVPRNPIQVAADGALLPLLIFMVLFAAATTTLPKAKQEILTSFADTVSEALIKLMNWVLWTAPVGVFGLAAPVTARTGMAMLQNLGVFILAVVIGLFIMKALVLLPLVRFVGGMRAGRFIRGTVGTYTVGFSTTTSVGTLPMMLQEAEKLGLSRSSYRLILPLAASINRPGSALFQGASLVFLASMYGVSLGPAPVAAAVLATFLAAMTVAPVPSASIVSLVPVLNVVGVPLAGLGILLGIDRVPDVFRSAANVIGHMAATTTVDAMTRRDEEMTGTDEETEDG
ncbi:dicarboxylate/amino acid:cation symporter [Candidatus Palauibacter sp.]|uniref:dicarboxylate/amino acid:cation symporter n=1 Tax=Candidatus Palauibacter sp. TaxID=3101350 RepID=UPI003CC57272